MLLRRLLVALTLIGLVAVGAMGSAQAAHEERKKKQVDAAVKELRGEVAESSKALQRAQRRLRWADAKLPAARSALAVAQGRLAAAQAHETAVADRLVAAQAAEQKAIAALKAAAEQVAHRRVAVGQLARTAYQSGGELAQIAIIFDAESAQDLAARMSYLRAVMDAQGAQLMRLRKAEALLTAKKAELVQVRTRVEEERAAAAAAVMRTQSLVRAAAELAAGVEALVAERRAAFKVAEREKAADEARYQEMQAESQRLAEIIKARKRKAPGSGGGSSPGGSALSYPVNGGVTSGFGMRYHPVLGYRKLHTGIDLSSPYGTPVKAARGGVVIQNYYNGAYGNRVVVDHGWVNGDYLVTTYNHLSRRSTYVGEKLSRGEVLGYVGSTGWSTGPHLHFEVMDDGEYRDPMRWL